MQNQNLGRAGGAQILILHCLFYFICFMYFYVFVYCFYVYVDVIFIKMCRKSYLSRQFFRQPFSGQDTTRISSIFEKSTKSRFDPMILHHFSR